MSRLNVNSVNPHDGVKLSITGSTDGALIISASGDNDTNPLLEVQGSISASGNLTASNALFTGNIRVIGEAVISASAAGGIFLGDANTDNVIFGADVSSSVIPNNDDTFDLGSNSQQWKDLYLDGTGFIDAIDQSDTTVTNNLKGDWTWLDDGSVQSLKVDSSNGNVGVKVADPNQEFEVAGRISASAQLSVGGAGTIDGHITGSGNLTISGASYFAGDITSSGDLLIKSLKGPSRIQLDGDAALPTIDNDTIMVFQRNYSGSASAGVSIIGHAAGESIIKLGDTDDEDVGRIRYQHTDNSMDFFTNNAQGMTLDASGNVTTSGAINIGHHSGSYSKFVLDGTGALPTIDNDTIAIFQRNLPGSSTAAISVIGHVGGESILKLGDTDDEDAGRIRYQHTDDSMDFYTNGSQGMTLDASGNVTTSGAINIGHHSGSFSKFQLDGAGALPTIDNDTIALFQRNLPGSSTAAITILAHVGGESILKLGDTDDEDIGRIRYMHSDNSMDFITNNTQQMSIDASGNITASNNISSSGYMRAPYVHIGNITPGGMRLGETGGAGVGGVMKFGNSAEFSATLTNLTASGTITAAAATITTLTATHGEFDTINTTQITSSIVTASVIYSSGSNIFGDAGDDTHTFNGNITASGTISASSYIRTPFLRIGAITPGGMRLGESTAGIMKFGDGGEWSATLTNLTASGNISGSSTSQVYAQAGNFDRDVGAQFVNATNYVTSVNITASNNIIATGSLEIQGNTELGNAATSHVTASGNISSSGYMRTPFLRIGNQTPGGMRLGESTAGIMKFGDSGEWSATLTNLTASGNISSSANLIGNNISSYGNMSTAGDLEVLGLTTLGDSSADTTTVHGNLTASVNIKAAGNISASGTLYGSEAHITGHITASGNISASGNMFANQLTAIHDMSAGRDLEVLGNTTLGDSSSDVTVVHGNLTASVNISASGNIFANQITAIHDMSAGRDFEVLGTTTLGDSAADVVGCNAQFRPGAGGMMKTVPAVVADSTPQTLTIAANAGRTNVLPDFSGDSIINLPTPTVAGQYYHFIYGGAAVDAHAVVIRTLTTDNSVYVRGAITHLDTDNQIASVICTGTPEALTIDLPSAIDLHFLAVTTGVWYIWGTATSATTPVWST